MRTPLACAQAEIRARLAGSRSPQDPQHAEDTLAWVLRLKPAATPALALAALAHDIDRAVAATQVQRAAFDDDDAFKVAHAVRGARILRGLLEGCGVDAATTATACRLVELHETGGEPDADVLKDADNLSYFRVNLPLYLECEGAAEALRRCHWGYRRLSRRAQRYYRDIRHDDPRLNRLMQEAAVPRRA